MKLRLSFRAPRRSESGLSLIELLIASGIACLALAAMASFAIYTSRTFVATGNYADLDRASRNALDQLTRDVRASRTVTAFTTNKLTLQDNNTNTLIWQYTPSTAQLTRQSGNTTQVMLQQCDYLCFSNYIRVPTNGWAWYPVGTNNVSFTKLVDVSWKCSRKILGQKMNTESVQTAKIVLRN